ncbi:MAG: hypothetical protein K6L80_11225 [Agarilytica sp.]
MNDIYEAPKSALGTDQDGDNNSGMKQDVFPEGVKGWSWGAFLLNWIWAISNKSYIGLLAIVPYIGFIFTIYLGIKGREMAWKNKRWESLDHFNRVQRSWSKWALILVGGMMALAVIGIAAAIVLPAMNSSY